MNTSLTIGRKIGLGFSLLLLILAVTGGHAVLRLRAQVPQMHRAIAFFKLDNSRRGAAPASTPRAAKAVSVTRRAFPAPTRPAHSPDSVPSGVESH